MLFAHIVQTSWSDRQAKGSIRCIQSDTAGCCDSCFLLLWKRAVKSSIHICNYLYTLYTWCWGHPSDVVCGYRAHLCTPLGHSCLCSIMFYPLRWSLGDVTQAAWFLPSSMVSFLVAPCFFNVCEIFLPKKKAHWLTVLRLLVSRLISCRCIAKDILWICVLTFKQCVLPLKKNGVEPGSRICFSK